MKKSGPDFLERKSRNSSLHFQSDHQYDTLSVNIGQFGVHSKKFVKKQPSRTNAIDSAYDSLSVQSVITGTGGRPLKTLATQKSLRKPAAPKVKNGRLSRNDDSPPFFDARGAQRTKGDASATEVVIAASKERNEDDEEKKPRKKKSINVYLQVPYKVKTYVELKNK